MIRSVLGVLAVSGGLLIANPVAAQDQAPPIATAAPDAPPPGSPPPETTAPKALPPETPAPETPAPETPAPETPAPEAPAPAPAAVSAPVAPPPEMPAPESAAPEPAAPAPGPAAPSAPVQVQTLNQLDMFSTGRDTGLGEDVWKGSSADIARAVIPGLATRPLSPAGVDLARRLLAQASTAPAGAGADLELAVARARALLALGDAEDASLVLDRTPGVSDHADLSQLAAEAALISEQNDKACRIADILTDGRGGLYWLRLRAFCQARAGKTDEAQLTFNLAGAQAKDVTTARLLAAFIAGSGDPGPASLHTGLGFALSSALKLDFAPALPTAAPAISRRWALKNQTATPAVEGPKTDPKPLFDQAASETDSKARARLQAAAAIAAGLGGEVGSAERAQLDAFELGRSEAPAARLMALNIAAEAGLKGETALLVLQIAQAAGAAGPAPVDRYWIIRALERVGLKTDAQAFAAEGLNALAGGR